MIDVLKKTKESISIRFILKIFQQLLSFISGIILANILSPDEFGVLAIISMIVYYCNSVSNVEMNSAIIQMDSINNDDINSVFTLNFIMSAVLVSFIFYFSGDIAKFFNMENANNAIKLMSIYILISVFYNIPSTILRRKVEYKIISIVELFESVLVSLTGIFLAFHNYSYWSIIYSTILWQFLFSILLIWQTNWVPSFSWSGKMKEIVPFGLWTFSRNQLEWIVSKIDYFVIGKFLGMSSLGLYEKSFEFTERALTGVSLPINAIFYSSFSRLKNDLNLVKEIFLEGILILTLICYPVLFGIYSVASLFVNNLLGEKWQGAVEPLKILAIAGVFRVLFGLTASANVALGKHKLHTACVFFCSSVFIVLCFIFVENGIKFIALSFLFYSVISFVFSIFILKINLNISIFELFKYLLFPFAGSLIMAFVINCINSYQTLFYNDKLLLIVDTLFGVIFYFTWIFLCFYFKFIEFKHLNMFKRS